MEFKVGDRVEFIGGCDIASNSPYLGMRGVVRDVQISEDPSESDVVVVRFDDDTVVSWYNHRFKLVEDAPASVKEEVLVMYDATTVVEACVEVKKVSDIVTSLQQDLQEINNLSPGYVSIGVGSSHFRLGNLSGDHDSELRKLLIAAREKNLADAEQLLKEKIEELSKVLTNVG